MPCELIREIRLFLIVLIVLFYSFQLSGSVSLARREDDSTTKRGESALAWEERPEDGQRGQPYTVKQVIWTPSGNLSILSELLEPQLDIKHPANPHPGVRTPEVDQTSDRLALISPTWTAGNVKEEGRPFAPDSEDGYQADFTGEVKFIYTAENKKKVDQSALHSKYNCGETLLYGKLEVC